MPKKRFKPMDWNTISWRGFEPVTAVSLSPAEMVDANPDAIKFGAGHTLDISLIFYFIPQLYAYAGRLITMIIFTGLFFCAIFPKRNRAFI